MATVHRYTKDYQSVRHKVTLPSPTVVPRQEVEKTTHFIPDHELKFIVITLSQPIDCL